MSSKAQKIKAIVKGPGEKPTFGTNPMDPWSAKANISEDALLNKYLTSRGINPLHVTKDQKVAHSKMGQFIKWKRDRTNNGVAEEVNKKDTVTLDIPLLIRVLELAREDIKTDMDLHRVVEKLINMRNKGMLTMDDYDTIANIKENHIAIAMGKMLDDEGSMVLSQLDQLERAVTMIRSYVDKDYTKQMPAWVQSKITLATDYIDTVGNYLSSKNEEVVHEAKSAAVRFQQALQRAKAQRERSERAGAELLKPKQPQPVQKENVEPIDELKKSTVQSYLDKKKDQTEKNPAEWGSHKQFKDTVNMDKAYDRVNDYKKTKAAYAITSGYRKEEIEESRKLEMSKSARMIKSLYKRKGVVKEELYDHEKEGKSVATPGKKPKLQTTDVKDSYGDNKPKAAAILSGGKTQTGEPRDTIEIDPMMKLRPNQPDPSKGGMKFNNTRND